MAKKTYAEFQSGLLFELGNRTDLGSYKAAWINNAYMSFCARRKIAGKRVHLPELESIDTSKATQDGITYVIKPTTAFVVLSVYDTTNDSELTYKPSRWYLQQQDRANTDNEGEPSYWSPYSNKLYLYKTPDDAYGLEIPFRRRPTLMSASTDTLDIGEEWDEIILKLAVIQSLEKLNQTDRAKKEMEIWLMTVRDMLGMWDEAEEGREEYARPDPAYFNWGY